MHNASQVQRLKAPVMLVAAGSTWVALALFGCNAVVERRGLDGQDAWADSGSSTSGGELGVGCPTEQPDVGSPCATSTVCSFGDSVKMACRISMWCVSGEWDALNAGCSPEGVYECPETVPVHLSECTQDEDLCVYAGGTLCDCSRGVGGLCKGSYTGVLTWSCKTPEPGCPELAPNRGTPCETEGLACHYGTFYSLAQGNAWCTDGLWSWEGHLECEP